MKLHTNPKTGQVMSINLNSSQMPNFLLPSHKQIFEFVQKQRSESRKRYLLPFRNPTLNVLQPTPNQSPQITFSLSNTLNNSQVRSFGHSSSTIKMMMKDNISENTKMSQGFYSNKILGVKKQIYIPQDTAVLKTEGNYNIDLRGSFVKPTQIAKLTGELNCSKILMRQQPPCSPRSLINSKVLMRSSLRRSSRLSKQKTSNHTTNATTPRLQRTNKFKKTINEYRQMYSHQNQLDSQSLQNTMNHVLAYENILTHLKKSNIRKK